jgi:hypothetical protein
MTLDRVFVLGSDALYREWGYTALSRGRSENRLYVTAPQDLEREEIAPVGAAAGVVDALVVALETSREHTLAIDIGAELAIRRRPTAELRRRQAELRSRLTDPHLAAARRLRATCRHRVTETRQRLEQTAAWREQLADATPGRRQPLARRHHRRRTASADVALQDARAALAEASAALERVSAAVAEQERDWLDTHHDALVEHRSIEEELRRRRLLEQRLERRQDRDRVVSRSVVG